MSKKASSGLSGSLSFRVLSISLIFLAIPLVLYSGVLYLVDYRQYVRNLFEDVELIQKEERAWLQERVDIYKNSLMLIEEFIKNFNLNSTESSHAEVTKILQKFTANQEISAIMYCKASPDGKLICQSSTLKNTVGLDFSKVKSIKELEKEGGNVFIGEDLELGLSLYVGNLILIDGKVEGVVLIAIALDTLLYKMVAFEEMDNLDISIMDKGGKILATTKKEYQGKIFSETEGNNGFTIEKIPYIQGGKFFLSGGNKQFISLSQFPNSDLILVISVSEYVAMNTFLSFLFRLAIAFVFIVVAGGVVSYLFTQRMAKPMQQLKGVMTAVGVGDLKVFYQKDRYGFEINHLGEAFNQMTNNLETYIEQVQTERGLKEAFEKELQIGHQIQKALLPSKEAEIQGVEIATYYSPAKEVAGDFYDYLEISDKVILITIADGVGKGISSCLYSFDLRSILKTAALDGKGLNDLVVKTNNIFCGDTKESCNFVTLVTGFLDKEKKKFTFTNAGHLPVFVKRKGGAIEHFTTKGIALGINPLESVELESIALDYGDFCILYTDGVIEAQNSVDELFTEKRFIESLNRFKGTTSSEFVAHIMEEIKLFVGQKEQFDDITLLVFQIH